jgi:hypothetical protein
LTYAVPFRIAAMSSSISPAAMPNAVGPITSAEVIVPVIVAGAAGQGWVPAGPTPLPHRNALTLAPLWLRAPKWMCACTTSPLSPE